jgi:hypothetical protein
MGIRMCKTQQLESFGSTGGKAKCNLNWDKKNLLLWAGNTAQPGEDGFARAYEMSRTRSGCPAGGSTISAPVSYSRSVMVYGPHVSAFAFLTDILDDDYVAVARCDNYNRNHGSCVLEFFSVPHLRRGMLDLATIGGPQLALRIPSGIGSLVHDTSLGLPSTAGGYFHASFIGTTPENVESTEAQGGDPEDRVFVFRTPILRTGVRKSVDSFKLVIGGVELVPAGTELVPVLLLKPEDDLRKRKLSSDLRNSSDSEECIGYTLPFLDQPDMGLSKSMNINFGLGAIRGLFNIDTTMVLQVPMSLCVQEMRMELGLDLQFNLSVKFSLSGEVSKEVGGFKAGVDATAAMQRPLKLQPTFAVNAKKLSASGSLGLELPTFSAGVKGYIQYPTTKWCKSDIDVSYVCGWKWGGESTRDFGRISFAASNLVPVDNPGGRPDPTPPTRGTVTLVQTSSTSATARFGSFTEDESEIGGVQLRLRNSQSSNVVYHSQSWKGESELWDGTPEHIPPNGAMVKACVVVTNTFAGSTAACSEAIRWDSRAPKVSALYTINPFTGNWRIPDALDTFLSTNTTDSVRFAIRLKEDPLWGPIKSAQWAISLLPLHLAGLQWNAREAIHIHRPRSSPGNRRHHEAGPRY